MAEIESETVYNIGLEEEELLKLADGGSVSFDLPTGDTISIAGDDIDFNISANPSRPSSGDSDEDLAERIEENTDDASLEEIEKLVAESEKEARQNRGPDVDEEDIPDEDRQQGNPGGGVIDIERGG